MDKTDLALCTLLFQNSRTPFRELGERLGLSVAAVHSRIQAMRDAGVIKAFTAKVSLPALGATSVVIWGPSQASSNEGILDRMRRDNRIYWVAFAGANFLYVGAYLRSATELESCVSFVAKEAEIPDPTIGFMPMGAGLPKEPILDRLDSRILWSLHADARKSVTDVAEEIGISAKTVGRRLERMIREGKVELSLEWYPDASNDIMTMWHLDLKPSAEQGEVNAFLMNKYAPNMLFAFIFSNLPRLLVATTWTSTMKELKDLQIRLRKEEPFVRVVPNVMYTGYILDTWRDDLLKTWAERKASSA